MVSFLISLLVNKISEVSLARSIPTNLAGSYFAEEVKRNYDVLLGFENELDVLKSNIMQANKQLVEIQTTQKLKVQ